MPPSRFKAVVPGQPPSVNHLLKQVWRTRADGTRYKGRAKVAEAKDYQRMVWGMVLSQRPRGWTPPPYDAKAGTGLVYLDVKLFLLGEVDADNLGKIICDGVKQALNCDDDQFLIRFQHKQIGVKPPYIELEIIP